MLFETESLPFSHPSIVTPYCAISAIDFGSALSAIVRTCELELLSTISAIILLLISF
uniref:PBSX family phage terminase large subunit n=1 Tax=uncultured marine virus TaxID=186617 RepID=A0A0F7L8K1_9VIRU|nr:PBSX family phage terminase large subunit [uncultured marine virus]